MTVTVVWTAEEQTNYRTWCQGDTAAVEGMRASDNPYPIASVAHTWWDLGLRGFPYPKAVHHA